MIRRSKKSNTRSLAMGLMMLATEVASFMPTKQFAAFGYLGCSHYEVTRDAMKGLAKDLYDNIEGVDHRTRKEAKFIKQMMKQAYKDVGKANADVDHDFHTSEKHFDGESIPEAQARLQMLREQAIRMFTMCTPPDVAAARSSIGQALHTLQDFYSHSNWIELGNTEEPNPWIGRNYYIDRLNPDVPTCQDCIKRSSKPKCPDCENNLLLKAPLKGPRWGEITTGYYSSETREKPEFKLKCSHGGIFDDSTSLGKGGINKDTIKCHMSPHREYHWDAIRVATLATRQFLTDLFHDLSPIEVAAFLGHSSGATISVENPRQPGIALEILKRKGVFVDNHPGRQHHHHHHMPGHHRHSKRDGSEDVPDFVFITQPMNQIDSLSDIKMTTNLEEFEQSLKKAAAAPVKNDKKKRGFGDQDGMTLVLDRLAPGSNFMFLRDTADSVLEAQEGFDYEQMIAARAAERGIKIFPVRPEFTEGDDILAQVTGGMKVLPKFVALMAHSLVDEESVTLFSSKTAGDFSVPVDSTVTGLFFVGDVKTVIKPDGKEADVESIFNSPMPGIWKVSATGPISVLGSSPLRIQDFEMTTYAGRPGHMGFYTVQSVLAGRHYTAVADVAGNVRDATFTLASGFDAMDMDLRPAENVTEIWANVTIPSGQYTLTMTGKDHQGHKVNRQWEVPVVSNDIAISVHGMILVDEKNVATAKIIVQSNRNGKVNLDFNLSNPAYKIIGSSSREINVGAGKEEEVVVKVQLGSLAAGSSTLTAFTKGRDGSLILGSRMLPLQEHFEMEPLKKELD